MVMINKKFFENKMYIGRCNVIVRTKKKNQKTMIIDFVEETILENVPCRLSFSSSPKTGSDNVATLDQEIKLFMDPKYNVPPGSKIVITQNEQTETYSNSGKPALYESHQEINLKVFKEWA